MGPVLAAAWVLAGCDDGRDDLRVVPVADEIEASPAAAAVEPEEASGTVEPPSEETAQPAPDIDDEEPSVADEATTPEPATSDVRVRVVRAVCGEDATRRRAPATRLGSRRGERGVRVRIRDLQYYCAPAPRFAAEVRRDAVVVRVLPPPPGARVARCVCSHDADVVVQGVPADVQILRLVDASEGDVIAEGRVGRPLGPRPPVESDARPEIHDPFASD